MDVPFYAEGNKEKGEEMNISVSELIKICEVEQHTDIFDRYPDAYYHGNEVIHIHYDDYIQGNGFNHSSRFGKFYSFLKSYNKMEVILESGVYRGANA